MGEPWVPKKLRPRHSEIIRLCHEGMTNVKIGEMVGISPVAVGMILRSPLAQAELARLKNAADIKAIDTPLRVRAALELDRAALDSLRFNADLVRDPLTDKKLRARVATHFLDRVMFDKNPMEQEGSYREILRSLNEIERQMADRPVPVIYDAKTNDERDETLFPVVREYNDGKAQISDAGTTSEEHATKEEEEVVDSDVVEFIKLQPRPRGGT